MSNVRLAMGGEETASIGIVARSIGDSLASDGGSSRLTRNR